MTFNLPVTISHFLLRELRSLRRELEQISKAEEAVGATLPRLSEEQMSQPFPEAIREHHLQTGELLLQLAVHLGYHLGQVSYHRRLVTGNAQGVDALSAAELGAARSVLDPPGA